MATPCILHSAATRANAGNPETCLGMYQAPAPIVKPAWQRNAIAVSLSDTRPKIAVVMDDMGATRPSMDRVIGLPGPLTLSWFPFASQLPAKVAAASRRDHEAILHMPMQSYSNSIAQTGPNSLRVDLPDAVNLELLQNALDAVPNIVGMNNHMGSVATRAVPLMDIVATALRLRGMLFLDSVTVAHSVALARAEFGGVLAASRDVFIDPVPVPAVIQRQLAEVEATSLRQGYAIAIGHPHACTIDALEAWLPSLAKKGFALWPLSATVALRNHIDLTSTPADLIQSSASQGTASR